MKTKLFFTFLVIAAIFYSCNEEPSFPKPKKMDEQNLTIKLENIPESAKGKSGVILVSKGDERYLTKSFSLEESNEVNAYLPKKATYSIKAFIKRENKDWEPDNEDQSGWYSNAGEHLISIEDPQLHLVTKTWDNTNTGGSMAEIISCNINNPSTNTSAFGPNSIVEVEINASENGHSNISKVSLSLDGNEITTMTEPLYYHDINTKDLENGKHVLKALAENENGYTASDEVIFYVDPESLGKAPSININELNSEVIQGDSVTIKADISDQDGEIVSADLYIDDQKLTFTDTTGMTHKRVWNTKDYGVGVHEIKVTAKDNDDNERIRRKNVTIIEHSYN